MYTGLTSTACCISKDSHSLTQSVCLVVGQYHCTLASRPLPVASARTVTHSLTQSVSLTSRSSVCVHWPHVHCLLHQQGQSLTHSLNQSVCLVVGQYHKIAAKRKRACLVDIDLNVKMQILKEVDSNAKQEDIACKFGINVSTVSKLVKNCEMIEKYFHSLLTSAGCKAVSVCVRVLTLILMTLGSSRSSRHV